MSQHFSPRTSLWALRMRFKTSARKMTSLSGRRYGVVVRSGEVWVWDEVPGKNATKLGINNCLFLSILHQFKYFHNRQISPRKLENAARILGEGRYRSKYEIFLVEIIPTGVHKSFLKMHHNITQKPNIQISQNYGRTWSSCKFWQVCFLGD